MAIEVFLTPKTFSEYLELAQQNKWTGTISISAPGFEEQKWNIYFLTGELIWSTGGEHCRRRWRRLLYQYCPYISIKNISWDQECVDYYQLRQWVDQGLLMLGQAKAIIQSNIAEVLFDILQQEIRVGLTLKTDGIDKLTTYLPGVDMNLILNHSRQNWRQWCEAGLEQLSPNHVPVILPSQQKRLQRKINFKLYRELVQVIDGEKSLRDVSLLLKQPLLYVALILNVYFHQELIKMYGISDLSLNDPLSPLSPTFSISIENLLCNSGVICSYCGHDNNSITASLCQKCNSPLAAKILPSKQTTSFSLKSLIPTLLLLLMIGGGYFIWHNPLSLNFKLSEVTCVK